jgi:hypothetical protein
MLIVCKPVNNVVQAAVVQKRSPLFTATFTIQFESASVQAYLVVADMKLTRPPLTGENLVLTLT